MRGFCGIGVENLKFDANLGTIWRSAYCLNASYIFVIGKKYKKQPSDVLCATKHIPLYEYKNNDHFLSSMPNNTKLIGVEISDKASSLFTFKHPQQAIYILGPEDGSLSIQDKCDEVVFIPTKHCLNVASAATIVLYDRKSKSYK